MSNYAEVKVSDITDLKGVLDILRCQYTSDEEIISIMNNEIEYRDRFFAKNVDVAEILTNN